MRHLITGGAGFIGSHLAERLLKQGEEVIVLDNLFTSKRGNIEHLLGDHRFEFVRGDVCTPFHFEVDRIWSLACPASPKWYQKNPARTIKTSVMGTVHALELAREVGARLLLTSTSEVYGDPKEHPQMELYNGNVNPIGPRACYDESKRCAETLAVSYAQQYGVSVKIGRLFNCYGPRMAEDDGRVVSTFICQALRAQPITIYGDGRQTRSFIYIDDMIDGLLRLMERGPEAYPVNLGNPTEFTILELWQAIRTIIGGDFTTKHERLPKDDPTRRCPDIEQARHVLDWNPKITLAEGLTATIAYFEEMLNVDIA